MMWILSFLPDWLFYAIALASFIALVAATFLKVIPFIGKYAIPIQLLSFVILLISIFLCGGLANEASWQLKVAKTNAEIAELKVKSEKVSTKVVTKYIDRIQVVKEKGNEIVKYVNKESDSKCELPNSFVVLHDAAAKNELPDPSRASNAGASDVKLSGATTTIVQNYGTCWEIREQLKALQEWVSEQKKLNP
jgi:energy-coupling factor transporter transmembrane protein EcfT